MTAVHNFLELRTYRIVPGQRDRFHNIFRDGAVPMLRRYGITVVGYGPGAQDEDHYFLMRAYPSLEQRQRVLDEFYGSEEWREDYEEVLMPLIETYHTVVIPASPEAVAELTSSIPEGLRAERSDTLGPGAVAQSVRAADS